MVIAARNEESTIGLCLTDFAAQTYPKELMEIVVADDASTDGTLAVIKSFVAANPQLNIKVLEMKDEEGVVSYKKRALSAAIHATTGELIVTTDADCRFGPKRLEVIAQQYEDNPVSLLLLPVVFNNEKSLFEKIQSLEFTGIMGITAASAGLDRPVSSNGANMAIERRLFERIGGFDDPYASGDDVFILYKTKEVTPKRIAFIKSTDAIVYTGAQKTLGGFFNQRVRWGAKAKGFSDVAALVSILLLFFSNLMVTTVIILGLIFMPLLIPALLIFSLKLIADMVFLIPVTRFYKKAGLLPFYPLMSLWLPIYISITGILSLRGNYVWKGRKLR
ncbi:MAG: glycosyltransferase [Sphingobacteriales bacterium JAD_PAG50586_3]|nr:MAG: glycosyltransferase [Sphingobacteriales bacterium JAD_PAG50586_3]